MSQVEYAEAVAPWLAHLRSGGNTPWRIWSAAPHDPAPASAVRRLPDAAHLELVRQVNLRAGSPLPDLIDRILTTPSPGRGRHDVPVLVPQAPVPPFGARPVNPEELPAEELLRLAVGVLAHLLPDLPADFRPPGKAPSPRPWRSRFQLHGPPGITATLRADLLRQGLLDTDWRTHHIVLAGPVESMMAEHWAARTRSGSVLKWSALWRRAQGRDAVPAQLDPVAQAQRLVRLPGRHQVHVVVASDPRSAAQLVAELLGATPLTLRPRPGVVPSDLLRRTNRLLPLTGGPDWTRLTALLAELVDDRPDGIGDAGSLGAPEDSLTWATDWADRTGSALVAGQQRAGYAVHGDPGALAPIAGLVSRQVVPEDTLALAVDTCVRAWQRIRYDAGRTTT